MNPDDSSYGILSSEPAFSHTDLAVEEVRWQGFHVLDEVLTAADLAEATQRLDAVLATQEDEFGLDALAAISDRNLARMPLTYDPWFLRIATQPRVLEIVRRVVGEYVILHVQNGIINTPSETHHQSKWHRDLPYQEWTSSRPLAVAALFCIDSFNPGTGGTHVLPFSHRMERFPSARYVEKHQHAVTAPSGSVILFDAMLFHRAGCNASRKIRRGINHVYTVPILKQQIDLPRALGPDFTSDPEISRLLGYPTAVRETVLDWRENKQRHVQ